VCTATRLSPALRAPPLCRYAVHTKRLGREQGGPATVYKTRLLEGWCPHRS
jgi:hypothetical protein